MLRWIVNTLTFFCIFFTVDKVISQEHWFPVSSPTTQRLVRLHFVDNLIGWAAGNSGTILHTTNGGESWEIQNTNITSNIVDVFFLDRNRGWALAWSLENPTGTIILKTSNGGDEWIAENYPEESKFMKKIFFNDSLNGVMGGNPNAFVYTNDGGFEWNPVSIDSGLLSNLPVLNFNFFNDEYGFANGGKFDISGVIWKTINGGRNWNSMAVGPEPIQEIFIFDSLNAIGVGGDFEYGTGVVRTKNAGKSWEYTSLNVFGVALALSFRTPAEGWACLGSAQQFVVTYDSGKTWSQVPTPDNSEIIDLAFTDSLHGYAVGDSGVIYKYDSSVVHISRQPTDILLSPNKLYQNYPNPFNPTTNIEFRIAESGLVKLSVYDLLGREMAILVSEKLTAGNYEVNWNARKYPSGIYLLRLEAGTFLDTKKLILLR